MKKWVTIYSYTCTGMPSWITCSFRAVSDDAVPRVSVTVQTPDSVVRLTANHSLAIFSLVPRMRRR